MARLRRVLHAPQPQVLAGEAPRNARSHEPCAVGIVALMPAVCCSNGVYSSVLEEYSSGGSYCSSCGMSHPQDPERFIPERWLEGTPEAAARPMHGWCPFGDGVRACIGTRFAIAVKTLADAVILCCTPLLCAPTTWCSMGLCVKAAHTVKVVGGRC